MNIYAVRQVKLSNKLILDLRKFSRFDGEDDNPESGILRDMHPEACGLRLRLSPGGAMTYIYSGRAKGKAPRTYMIGDAREISLKRGREISAEFAEQISRGEEPRVLTNAIWTFRRVFEKHNEYKKGTVKDQTLKTYNYLLGKLHPHFKQEKIQNIDEEMLEKEHKRIKKEHSGDIADRVFSNVVQPTLGYAMIERDERKKRLITHNPFKVMYYKKLWHNPGGKTKRIKDAIDSDHLKVLMDSIDEIAEGKNEEIFYGGYSYITPFVISRFFKFLLFTGFRPGEAASIEWHQVSENCENITWDDTDAQKKLKNPEKHINFPLNSEAQKCLIELKEIQGGRSKWVFPSRTPTIHIKSNPTDYINLLQKICEKNGVKRRFTNGIYRKAFQTYGNALLISDNTIRRMVFHTQKCYDVQSGYVSEPREILRKRSQEIADFILREAGRKESAGEQNEQLGKIGETEQDKQKLLDTIKNTEYTKEEVFEIMSHLLNKN